VLFINSKIAQTGTNVTLKNIQQCERCMPIINHAWVNLTLILVYLQSYHVTWIFSGIRY